MKKNQKITIATPEYSQFVEQLKARVASARLSAARSVNSELILLYLDLGRGITEKQAEFGWGQSVVERVADDLRRSFPSVRGFSARNLRDMERLYKAYSEEAIWRQPVAKFSKKKPVEFMRQLVAEVPWGQNHFQ